MISYIPGSGEINKKERKKEVNVSVLRDTDYKGKAQVWIDS